MSMIFCPPRARLCARGQAARGAFLRPRAPETFIDFYKQLV